MFVSSDRSCFESKEGQRKFSEWQEQRDTENSPNGEAKPDESVMRSSGKQKARGWKNPASLLCQCFRFNSKEDMVLYDII